MTTPTAADFAAATFALKLGLYTACRSTSGFWRTESGTVLEDEDMAEGGWRIVTPAPDPSDPDVIERAREAYRQRDPNGVSRDWMPAVVRAVLTPAPERNPEAEKLRDLIDEWHSLVDPRPTLPDFLASRDVSVGGGEG